MPDTKILARDHDFALNTGTEGAPVWVDIKGVNTFTPSPTIGRADTTTFDEDGLESHLPASRGLSFTLAGKVLYVDSDRTARDPGQLACIAWASEIGPSGLKQFRITYPDQASSTDVFYASASATPGGGGVNDASNFNLDIQRSGATTSSDIGAAPSVPGTPTGVAGDDLVTVTWTGSVDTGGHFEVVSVASVGETEITRVTSTSPYTFNGLASATAYKFKVRAVSPTGVRSAFSALSAEYTTT